MVKPATHLAVCGDSFGVGSGLPAARCYEDNYSGHVARYLGIPQRVYARSGCCNFTIYLQVRKIIEQMSRNTNYRPFVLITTTFHERMIFPLDDGFKYTKPNLSGVEYASYHPYGGNIDCDAQRQLEFPLDEQPRLVTETISNIDHYMAGKIPSAAALFRQVNEAKFDAIKGYFTELFDTGVKHEYDNALFITMHYLLQRHGIPHLIMGHNITDLAEEPYYMPNDWGHWSRDYPDDYGSGHCNEEGNRLVGMNIIKHITDNNLL